MLTKNSVAIVIVSMCMVLCYLPTAEFSSHSDEAANAKYNIIKSWADKLGVELWHLGEYITRLKDVQDSFKQAQVVPRVGQKIVEQMANDIKYLMDSRVSAVRRIMDAAEITAMSHQHEPIDIKFQYYNAKDIYQPGEMPTTQPPLDVEEHSGIPKIISPPREVLLTPSPHFFNTPVNTSFSTVHVPLNVFDRADEVIKAIKWSEKLDSIFHNNYVKDPTLSWQFFSSATGFTRFFPASQWETRPVDLFDGRLRSWFIEAATSPKDIVILLDNSGSMTGQRKDIARYVVGSILDTLGGNDFVNIYKFAKEIVPIVDCFEDTLVQATLGNVRELKQGMEVLETKDIANFSSAFTKAFEILAEFRSDERQGANCNQAIMLITDGVPYSYSEVFEEFNWMEMPAYMPVRIFTYLIGKEVADVKEVKWIACANQGYYVHLSTLAEVREQVLNYIPVMARPLVLGKTEHPVIWTQVYADVVDPKMTDYLWDVNECIEQKERFLSHRSNPGRFLSPGEQSRRYHKKMKSNLGQSTESDNYHLMVSVAMPAYDKRENATRIAYLLGVAGTDVPVDDIKRLLVPYTLGVNGYAFIVTNNGFIVTHPDHRPYFQNIMKPAYNSVDMAEVELMDDDSEPRDFKPELLKIREAIINQTTGSRWLSVKYHLDDMKRVSRIKRQYYYTPIQNTPYTLVITYPDQYGLNHIQIKAEDEIHRLRNSKNISSFFKDQQWKIHPEWLYCKHSNITFASPEAEFLHFVSRIMKSGWRWPLNRTPPPPEHAAHFNSTLNSSAGRSSSDSYYCNRNLVQALVYDAHVTHWFSTNVSFTPKDEKTKTLKQRFGITVAFVATQSGLMRWVDFHNNVAEEYRPGREFSENNRKAIDEIWYKRAVEQHFVEPQSFVFSVPHDAGNRNDTLVTASHAVFHTDSGRSAPVAVVGFQFQHSALYALFKNITHNCGELCKNCSSDDTNCYVLDNNGYVIISFKNPDETGRFYGEVPESLMHRLVEERVYKEIKIYDYQAVCFELKNRGSYADYLKSPLFHLLKLFKRLGNLIVWSIIHLALMPAKVFGYPTTELIQYVDSYHDQMVEHEHIAPNKSDNTFQKYVLINRTRPQICDHHVSLYTLEDSSKNKTVYQTPSNGCERPFVVMPIPKSNLILLVAEAFCPLGDQSKFLTTTPMPIDYNSSLSCHKARSENILTRKRPVSCINRHHNESAIELCGRAGTLVTSIFLLAITTALRLLL